MNEDFPHSETWGPLRMGSKGGAHGDVPGRLVFYAFGPWDNVPHFLMTSKTTWEKQEFTILPSHYLSVFFFSFLYYKEKSSSKQGRSQIKRTDIFSSVL